MKDKAYQYFYELICLLEGEKLDAYLDSEGIVTIGVGITSTFMPGLMLGKSITKEESQRLLKVASNYFLKGLEKIQDWDECTSSQQAALLSFAYNTGYFYGHKDFNTLNRALAIGCNNPAVPKALLLYVNPGSPSELGLKRRRRAEGLVWYGKQPKAAVDQAWSEVR
jgi:GH24 family phage-related lysozyme (muramidase)